MPPYPWYFGGKYYNYIFTDPKEIHNFCAEKNLRFASIHLMLNYTVKKI